MCGIVGIIAFNENGKNHFSELHNALKTLEKRGPDSEGVFEGGDLILGHRRLSILDLSENAAQPMHSHDDRFVLVFNGEIFNYKELKEDLIKKGFAFKTASDTEVLINLYIAYGAACINKLNGFFAFCIYDKAEKKGIIVRDRFGIKPLVYYKDDNAFFFASELKALVLLGIPKALNHDVLPHYFSLGYIPAPNSIYKNVFKLEPGEYIEFNTNGEINKKKYYSLSFPVNNELEKYDYVEKRETLKALISDAVKIRLIADVPVGAFLSGGIDSSIICAAATEHTSQLHTFSVGFSSNPYIDESKYANLVAKHLGTNHITFDLSDDEMLGDIDNVLGYMDEPFADSSAIAVYALSKHTSTKVKVSLSGDGGDELFGGYRKHRAEWVLRNNLAKKTALQLIKPFVKNLTGSREGKYGDIIRKFKKITDIAGLNKKERYLRLASVISENEINFIKGKLKENKININMNVEGNALNDFLWNDLQLVLPNDMLHKVDSMSMANSLEVRVPLLDYRIVNFANSLSEDCKIDATRSKKILWDSYADKLPKEIYIRKKMGFEVPLESWMKKSLQPMLNDLTSNSRMNHELFDYNYVKSLSKSLYGGRKIDNIGFRLWSLLVFQHWFYKNNPTL